MRRTKEGLKNANTIETISLENGKRRKSHTESERFHLPPLKIEYRWVPFNPQEKALYQKYWNLFILKIQRYIESYGRSVDAIHILSAITLLRRFCVHPWLSLNKDRVKLLNDYLGNFLFFVMNFF